MVPIGVQTLPHAERRLTSQGCDRMRRRGKSSTAALLIMSSLPLPASSDLTTAAWHGSDWAGCYRRVRSLQRRLVQAVQRGAWRKGTRLRYLLVHSLAARA